MDMTLNGQRANGIVMLDSQPDILHISGLSYGGTVARLAIRMSGATPSAGDTVTINGETVTAVASQQSAGPRDFGVAGTYSATAYNLSRALSACTPIVSAYSVRCTAQYVILEALGQGEAYAITYESDISGIEFEYTAPSQTSSAKGVEVSITRNNPQRTAVLAKSVVSDVSDFDLSPVLSSMTEWGKVTPVTITSTVRDVEGEGTQIGTFNAYAVRGRHLSAVPLYMTGAYVAQPIKASPTRDVYNNDALYADEGSSVEVSYWTPTAGTMTASAQLLDSAYAVIRTSQLTAESDGETISVFEVPSGFTSHDAAWYLSITMPGGEVIRYNLFRSGMSGGSVRIRWRNAMGGVSFFDFSSDLDVSTDIDTVLMTDYEGAYGYYSTDGVLHSSTPSSVTATKTYTASSPVIEGIGLPVLDDLASSPLVWLEEDGRKRQIILTRAERVRVASNDTWRIRISYKYSINQ